jgi:hypothetical protein
MEAKHLDTLRHMLGINTPYAREPVPYRDYYCANPGDEHMMEMEALGLIRQYAERGGYQWFCCTDVGRSVGLASHKTIRKSRGARLYSKFLDVRDCWPELTFRRFITDPELKHIRRTA